MALRHRISTLAIITLCSVATATANAADQINWAANLDEARALAQQQNKLLLIHFWGPDCPPCRAVEANVFPSNDVAQTINQYFIPLKVNGMKDVDIRDHFKVDRWPTDVISTVGGQAIHSMATIQDPSLYVQELAAIAIRQRGSKAAGTFVEETRVATNQPQMPAITYGAGSTNHALNNSLMSPSKPAMQNGLAQNHVAQNHSTGLPSLPDTSAIARRPGVDLSNHPSKQPPLGGPMGMNAYEQSASQLNTGNRFAKANQSLQPQGVQTRQQQYQPQVVPRTQAQNIQNRFAQTNLPSTPSPGQFGGQMQNQPGPSVTASQSASTAGAQIQNPYLNPAPQNQVTNQQLATNQSAPGSLNAQPQPGRSASNQNSLGSTPPQENSNLGLDGRCPVTLITKSKWRKGDTRWGAVHRGHTYLFAGPDEQQRFLTNPDEFSPILAGMDVVQLADVGQVIQGNRRYGVLYDDDGAGPNPSRIYLFDSVATRNRFEASPESFARPVIQAMQAGNLDTLLR